MAPDAARAAARREFGPVTQIVEESRDARGVMWVANAWNDLKYGVRLMRRGPGFVVAAILTVALGIGATTAMFSVVYGVLLQPLPYGEPDRLVNIWTTAPKRGCRARASAWPTSTIIAPATMSSKRSRAARGREFQSHRSG
jgi:putative ABC transport system permease protein